MDHSNELDFAKIPVALTIAGSDSGGGAGIQTDLRVFAFHCVHGTSAITCVTAQNTLGVTRVDALPADAVIAQIDAVTSDFHVGAIKTGMLLNAEIISAVADRLANSKPGGLVVDPVMVARNGDRLIDEQAIKNLREELLPLADLVTPNVHEAQILADRPIRSLDELAEAAQIIHGLGSGAVIVKGGGLMVSTRGVDIWYAGDEPMIIKGKYIDTPHTHGTGCTFSAAITANLARGKSLWDATTAAKEYVTDALRHALPIGQGTGPTGHFFPLLKKDGS